LVSKEAGFYTDCQYIANYNRPGFVEDALHKADVLKTWICKKIQGELRVESGLKHLSEMQRIFDSVTNAEDKKQVFKDLSPAIDETRHANHELFNIKHKISELLEYALHAVKHAYSLTLDNQQPSGLTTSGVFAYMYHERCIVMMSFNVVVFDSRKCVSV
jgi:hypothetical protein